MDFKRPDNIMFEEQRYITEDLEGFAEEGEESVEEFPVHFTAEYEAQIGKRTPSAK